MGFLQFLMMDGYFSDLTVYRKIYRVRQNILYLMMVLTKPLLLCENAASSQMLVVRENLLPPHPESQKHEVVLKPCLLTLVIWNTDQIV